MMWRAALACHTRSVGTISHRDTPAGVSPQEVALGVFLCGHNDLRSFGALAWSRQTSDLRAIEPDDSGRRHVAGLSAEVLTPLAATA